MTKTITITKKLICQFEAVRIVGRCNMMDIHCVRQEALRCDYHQLADAALNPDVYIGILSDYEANAERTVDLMTEEEIFIEAES